MTELRSGPGRWDSPRPRADRPLVRRSPEGLRLVRLLDVDPDLGLALAADDLAEARRELVARATWCRPGAWAPPAARAEGRGWLGVLILEGLIARTVHVAGRRSTELVGPGDLVRPWPRDEAPRSLGSTAGWDIVDPARIALLDAGFAAKASRWPGIAAALLARAAARGDDLAQHLAILHLPRIQDRVLAVLWHFADRWGRVTVDGIVLPLPLSHSALASVIGTGRPSVTTALSTLRREGLVRRRPDGAWLLLAQAPERLRG